VIEFVVEPAPVKTADSSIVMFVVDCSGSMSVTEELPKGFQLFQLKSASQKQRDKALEELKAFNTDNSYQYLPNQRRDQVVCIPLRPIELFDWTDWLWWLLVHF